MKYVPKAITRTVGRTVLKAQKNSPTILFAAGVVGFGATVVMACKATLQVEPILTDHNKQMLDIGRASRTAVSIEDDRERRQVALNTTYKLGRLYAPAVLCGTVSVICLTKSHRILTERNAQLTAAYVTLQQFLENYRSRVREKIGEEEERGVYYTTTPVELAQDTENGPVKVYGTAIVGGSPYSCILDDTKRGIWQDSQDFTEHYIRLKQDHLTDMLRSRGHLFLNEVYDQFAVDHTSTGAICGWVTGTPGADDFVDIFITPIHDGRGSLLLDFNCHGEVWDLIGDGNSRDAGFRQKVRQIRRRS